MKKQLLAIGLVIVTGAAVAVGIQQHSDNQVYKAKVAAVQQAAQVVQLNRLKSAVVADHAAMVAKYNGLLGQCKAGIDAYALLTPVQKARYEAAHHNQVPSCPTL